MGLYQIFKVNLLTNSIMHGGLHLALSKALLYAFHNGVWHIQLLQL